MNRKIILSCCIFTVLLLLIYMAATSNSTDDKFSKSQDFSKSEIKNMRRFRDVFVHLDLKGAPPKIDYLEKILGELERYAVDGILIEYEDMFPFWGEIEEIKREDSYSKKAIQRINEIAFERNLEVIPLLQTFGHLEFVLKHSKYQNLSENPFELNTICITEPKSFEILNEMLRQIRLLHPNSTRIHIGSDEAYHIAEDERCLNRMKNEQLMKSDIKLKHISKTALMAKSLGFSEIFAWNDMFDKESEESIKKVNLHKLITPVVWGYSTDVTTPGYFPDGLFDRIYNVFEKYYIASAFKGANGINQQFLNISRYIENHQSYVKLLENHRKSATKMNGIFVTGWSRFAHSSPFCEILPVSIPSLIANLLYINFEPQNKREIWRLLKEKLKCHIPHMVKGIQSERVLENCDFEGIEVFRTFSIKK
ncbi:unnamed protein product [Caenorhabditis angaria]|uniref:beta-N-acetylhexosaminidase n=1 Tax=Caenorhabditis angaria TaxID=860376 RepID=A0A9P1MWC2_9PELO|nr:unnamed protein product [Caenorhabditis angaria]